MKRRDFLKASTPALALPALAASDSAAEPFPTELTIVRVTESELGPRGVRCGDLAVVVQEPGYRCDSTYLDPNGRAVVVQHLITDGIRIHTVNDAADDEETRFNIIAKGLSKEEFAERGYRYIESVFYRLESGRLMQGCTYRSDEEVAVTKYEDAETYHASTEL